MADFRKWILAFATLVLVLGSVVPAAAQGPEIQCSVSSVPPTLRHEGLTELIGDIVLTCVPSPTSTGPVTTGTVPQANISVSLGATLGTPSIGLGLDSLLLVDDPSPANQDPCPTPTNGLLCPDAASGGASYNRPGVYNVFQGISGGPGTNSITFLGVPVDPPATGFRTYRITNVRIQGPSVPASAFGLTPVYAFVSASSSTSIAITQATAQPVVGFVSQGLIVTPGAVSTAFLQCQSVGVTAVGSVTFTENFQTAFKVVNQPGCGEYVTGSATKSTTGCQDQPGVVYGTESGLQVTLSTGVTGLATQGTEFQTVISNIPNGVSVYVDAAATDAVGGSAVLISPTSTGTPALILDNTSGTTGSVTAVWEVTAANNSATDSFTFNIYISYTGAPGTPSGTPTPNVTASALSGFAPQVAAWTGSGPIPEFSSQYNYPSPGPQNLFTVTLCQTILLFPYVTDVLGFDTGIAISNTSLDNLPVGASHQTGSCSVAFWGGAPGTAGGVATNIGTTGNTPGFVNSDVAYGTAAEINGNGLINPGQTWAFSLSETDSNYNTSATAGMSGYAIATCNFQFAHGYSFVSDTGIMKFAAAYLALVLPDTPRNPEPFVCASVPGFCSGQAGEQLVH